MIKRILLWLAVCLFPVAHAALSTQLQVAADVLHQTTGADVRPYSTRDFGREKYEGAVSVLIPEVKSEQALTAVRQKLPQGYVAFIGTTRSLTKPAAMGVEVVAAPGSYPLDILEIAKTDAVNYGMVTQHLKEHLGKWHASYGIDIWQAETDTIQLKFRTQPSNIKAFAQEVYKFCPDLVDQGVGTLPALVKSIREQKGLFLWWD